MNNMDNMFSKIMHDNWIDSISGKVDRIKSIIPTKMKTVRTFQWKIDPEMYANNGIEGATYPVYDGYNKELSVLLFDLVCHLTGSITFDNAIHTIQIMKNYIPKPIKPKKPKIDKPIPKQFQINCNKCNTVKDIRVDFYKGRLICKKCFSKQVVNRRK